MALLGVLRHLQGSDTLCLVQDCHAEAIRNTAAFWKQPSVWL